MDNCVMNGRTKKNRISSFVRTSDLQIWRQPMELKLKMISKDGVEEALSKVTLYRYLNEPEEAESICHDILATDPENQMALRMLGLTITDQFSGQSSDRYADAGTAFQRLNDPYERLYYAGLLCERRAKAQMRAGRPPQ